MHTTKLQLLGNTVYAEGFRGTFEVDGSSVILHYEETSCGARTVSNLDLVLPYEFGGPGLVLGSEKYEKMLINPQYTVYFGCFDGNTFLGGVWSELQAQN